MIDASDLSTAEVRSQYVLPLLHNLLKKTSLVDYAAALGVNGIRCEIDAPLTSVDTGGVSTLFQEIATQYPSARTDQDTGGTSGRDESNASSGPAIESYADLLEEASAVCAYMKPQEKAVVATVASSCLLSFLVPQLCFQGFLRSYYVSAKTTSPTSTPVVPSLEERLVNATLSNNNQTSGGVFPYSASRMRSLVVDDDGFTSSSFHRFLVQGLRPYLSCGMALDIPSKDVGSNKNACDAGGITWDTMWFQAGVDLIQLLAMAICLNPPTESTVPASLSMEADKGAGGEHVALDSVRQLVHSTIPFSFQLSYSDRLQLVRLCTEFFIPEREDSTLRTGEVVEVNSKDRDSTDNDAMLVAALHQLRSALFCFASFNAHSEKDARVSYEALAYVAMSGGGPSIQVEFERLLVSSLESTSEYLTIAIGDCLVRLVTRHNGSRYYADGKFVRFALGLLGECINDRIQMRLVDSEKRGCESTNEAKVLIRENATKRQKAENTISTKRKSSSSAHHFIVLMKVTRPLFYFLLDTSLTKRVEEKGVPESEHVMEDAEAVAKCQLIRDVTLLLCYPSDLSVVQSASQLLALALSYDRKFIAGKDNVKHLFRFTRQALDNASGSVEVVQALRPFIITASRQSRTFAESLLSYAVKACSGSNRMKWKIANLISSACPFVVSKRLAELEGKSQDSDEFCGDIACDEIMTRLSCTMEPYASTSSETVKRCLSLVDGVTNRWTLFQLVRYSFATSSFGFAHQILSQQRLQRHCPQQQHFLWLTVLSRIAQAEEILEKNGAVGISESLETLSSSYSTLQSLAAIEQDNCGMSVFDSVDIGKFGFQLDFLEVKIDFLNLCMITRSLCSESIITGGDISARSKQRGTNLPKCFGMLTSKCRNIYRLHGLHYSQKTRSVLRNLLDLCQFMQENVLLSFGLESGPNKKQQNVVQDCLPKGDKQCPMGSLLVRLRGVRAEKSIDSVRLWDLLDTLLRCPMPFPPGFLRIKSIPCSLVNLSADTRLLPMKHNYDHIDVDADASGKCVEVTPGLPFKLILSGIIPEEFIRSADVQFTQIIAWKTVHYEHCLYDDDDAKVTHSDSGAVELNPPSPIFSSSLQPRGQFVLQIACQPIAHEGVYRVNVKLGCRDIRCTEWSIPTMAPLELLIRVEDYSE